MATAGQEDRVQVNAFRVGDTLLFAHYFEEDAVFEKLQPYYEHYDHRFEVPAGRIPEIRDFLEGRGYDLVTVEEPEEFAVAVRKFTDHPSVVFDASVIETGTQRYNVFLMESREAVAKAVERGARPLPATDLTLALD